MIEWDYLRVVLAVHRGGSMAAGAERLSVDRATVQRRLDALEAQLKSRLFDRRPDGCVLTPAGRNVIGLIERVEHPTNRRVRLVRLSEAGWDTLAKCEDEIRAREDRLAAIIGPDLGRSLAEVLDRAADTLAGGYFGDADAEAEAVANRRRPSKGSGLAPS